MTMNFTIIWGDDVWIVFFFPLTGSPKQIQARGIELGAMEGDRSVCGRKLVYLTDLRDAYSTYLYRGYV